MGVSPSISWRQALLGSLIGAWSHVWLDSYMHADVMPWWPVFTDNPDRGDFDLVVLHVLCVFAGLWGLLRLLSKRMANLSVPVSPDSETSSPRRPVAWPWRWMVVTARSLTGLLALVILLQAVVGELSAEAQRTARLDAAIWRNAAALSYTEPNPRYHMVEAAR